MMALSLMASLAYLSGVRANEVPSPSSRQGPKFTQDPSKEIQDNKNTDTRQFGTVQFGDTAIKIARRYGLSISDLVRLNPGLDFARLAVGSRINLKGPNSDSTTSLLLSLTEKHVEQSNVASYSCSPSLSVRQDAVSYMYSAYTVPRVQGSYGVGEKCVDSAVRLFCLSGSCGVFFDSGQYGYHPLRCSTVRISRKAWGWCGDQPVKVASEMWGHLRDGVEVATNLSLWPKDYTNLSERPMNINKSKILTYNASLGIATSPLP